MLWGLGALISMSLAYVAYHKQHLTRSGSLAAIVVGTTVVGGTGLLGFLVLAYFFATSSYLSKWRKGSDGSQAVAVEHKGDQRDAYQVLANGGVAAGCALIFAFSPSPWWLFGFAASLAAASSDTWASEVGKNSPSLPLDLLTRKKVAKGTSGGITLPGTVASMIGAWSTALVSWPLLHQQLSHIPNVDLGATTTSILILLGLAGWIGNWVDTFVGAKWQGLYHCPKCQRMTEHKHHCHQAGRLVKGTTWLNNDAVNALCTGSAALVAILLTFIFLT
ncbi:DUF92 domain-containing protein [Caldalkalibacillus salinus]|uniref:DUF92 domain-containing protein n=1 Tax=Caldalkalibacillus salinus TaxID=2803787 RepID=UPI0019209A9C|nr:DUF92 domain-containing protein [Caldalkalibacillus salinus]